MKKRILILDNYDSFTYNLVQYVMDLSNATIVVKRNDEITLEEVSSFDTIIFSPGPGLPENAGIMLAIIKKHATDKKMLGVCLGYQAMGMAFGAKLTNLDKVYHGVKTKIDIISDSDPLYDNIPKQTEVGRYHSWVITPETLSDDFEITSIAENDTIMSIKHKKHSLWGVQFHPESIMTDDGKKMIANFLKI